MKKYITIIRDFLTKNTSSKQTVIKNTFWLLLAEGVSKGSVFFMTFVIAKFLGVEEFWKLSYVMSFAALYLVIVDYGLVNIMVREVTKQYNQTWPYLLNGIVMKILLWLLSLIVISIVAFFISSSDVFYYVLLYAAYNVINNIGEFIRAFFRPNEQMQHEAILKLINGILFFLIVGLATYYFRDIQAIIYAYLVCASLNLVLSLVYIYRYFDFHSNPPKLDRSLIVWMLKKWWILALWIFFVNLYINFDQFYLGYLWYNQDLWVYSLAYKMTFVYTIIFAMFYQTLLPRVTKNPTREMYIRWLKRASFINIGLVLLYGGFASFMYFQPYRDIGEFRESFLVFLALLLYCVFESYGHRWYINLLALWKDKHILKIFAICAVVNVLLNIIFIPLYSYRWAVGVNVFTYLVYFILSFLQLNRFLLDTQT